MTASGGPVKLVLTSTSGFGVDHAAISVAHARSIDRKCAVATLNVLVGMQLANLLRFFFAIMLGGGSCWEAALAHNMGVLWYSIVDATYKKLGLLGG